MPAEGMSKAHSVGHCLCFNSVLVIWNSCNAMLVGHRTGARQVQPGFQNSYKFYFQNKSVHLTSNTVNRFGFQLSIPKKKSLRNMNCPDLRLSRLECYCIAFKTHGCSRNANSTKCRPLNMFHFCPSCLEFLQGAYLNIC